jgi:hypothetical protein
VKWKAKASRDLPDLVELGPVPDVDQEYGIVGEKFVQSLNEKKISQHFTVKSKLRTPSYKCILMKPTIFLNLANVENEIF